MLASRGLGRAGVEWGGGCSIMLSGDAVANLEAFQDSLSTTVIARLAPAPARGSKRGAVKGRKKEIKPVSQVAAGASAEAEQSGAGDLSDFIQVR